MVSRRMMERQAFESLTCFYVGGATGWLTKGCQAPRSNEGNQANDMQVRRLGDSACRHGGGEGSTAVAFPPPPTPTVPLRLGGCLLTLGNRRAFPTVSGSPAANSPAFPTIPAIFRSRVSACPDPSGVCAVTGSFSQFTGKNRPSTRILSHRSRISLAISVGWPAKIHFPVLRDNR